MRTTYFLAKPVPRSSMGLKGVSVILRSYRNAVVLKTQSFKEFLLLYFQKGGQMTHSYETLELYRGWASWKDINTNIRIAGLMFEHGYKKNVLTRKRK